MEAAPLLASLWPIDGVPLDAPSERPEEPVPASVDPSLVAELDDLRAAAGLPPQELTEAELGEEARTQIEEGRGGAAHLRVRTPGCERLIWVKGEAVTPKIGAGVRGYLCRSEGA